MTYEQYKKQVLDSLTPQTEKSISDYNAAIDNQIAAQNQIVDRATGVVTQQYNDKINETKGDYLKLYDANEVQKKINERAVAERMANLGLTDSGVNRTQQTAVQLSYGNAKYNLSVEEQKAVNSLKLQLTAYLAEQESTKQGYLAEGEANKAQYAINARQQADDSAAKMASDMYQNDVAQATSIQKARISAAAKSSSSGNNANKNSTAKYKYTGIEGKSDSLGKYKIFEDSSGKQHKFAIGTNPYTGTNNLVQYKDAIKQYGTFSNGYQPRGIIGVGKLTASGLTTEPNGKGQTVWQGENGKHYIWHGTWNAYEEIDPRQ